MEGDKIVKRQIAFNDAEFQAEAQAIQDAKGCSWADACRAVYTQLKSVENDGAAEAAINEMVAEKVALTESLETANNALAERDAKILELENKLFIIGTENGQLKEQKPFCDLSVLDAETSAVLIEVRNEMLGKQIHPSTADWIVYLVHAAQKSGHYVPDSGSKISKSALKFKKWQSK